MDVFILKSFFLELLELSYNDLKPGWGNPCSELLKKMCLRQDAWIGRIIGDFTGNSHEMRLNGSGLKMWWEVRRNCDRGDGFKCSIGGDQAKEYPLFCHQAERLIKKYNFNKR